MDKYSEDEMLCNETIEQPTIAECEKAGRGPEQVSGKFTEGGSPNTLPERQRFEAYMRGHCWDAGNYDEQKRCYDTVMVRMLYGVWRDRGALAKSKQPADAVPVAWIQTGKYAISFTADKDRGEEWMKRWPKEVVPVYAKPQPAQGMDKRKKQ